jgi:hypothetical protein
MKHILSSALCVIALATSAFADTRLADINTHAGQIKKGSEQINLLLKAKQPDAQALRAGMNAIGGDIENLHRLVVELTEANPQFIQRGDKDWDLLKTKVQLLAIFHNAKDELIKADDMRKNRSLLQAHAKGLGTRASMLQETAQRMQRSAS